MEENKEQRVEWNLSSAIIAEIGAMLAQASSVYTKGKIQKCFYYLNAIKMRIIQTLDNKEREQFKKLELSLFNEKRRNKFGYLLADYNTLLMDKLEKYGFLLQKKADKSSLTA
jgi:hypothetical protein